MESHEQAAARMGAKASMYMDPEQPESTWGVAAWRAHDLAIEAARHAFKARPDLKREA